MYDNLPIISSLQNPRLKSLVKLSKRRERDKEKVFIIEGIRPIERALKSGFEFTELFICSEFFYVKHGEDALVKTFIGLGIPITNLSKEAFSKIAYREHPEGMLAIGKQWPIDISNIKLSKHPLLIVLESVEKPGNLGTILRTADAIGADGVILCDPGTDIFNPNVIRASTGTIFSVPVAVTSSSSAINYLKNRGITILAATPHTKNIYTDVNLSQPVAIVMGAEDTGLSRIWMDSCDLPVKLPMLGIADSLNVSAATVAICYEALRQRQAR